MANPLIELHEKDRELAMKMLRFILDHPDEFTNQVRFLPDGAGVSYFIIDHKDRRGKHPDIRSTHAFLEQLRVTGVIVPLSHTSFSFSPAAIEGYRRITNPSPAQIRSSVGRYLHERYEETGEDDLQVSVEDLAKTLRVDEKKVHFAVRMLCNVGLLLDVGPINSSSSFFHVQFTQAGHTWAVRGFREEEQGAGNVTNVAVNVQFIDISGFMQDLERADIDDEVKEKVEDLTRQLQREPSVEKVSRLLEMAANAQQLIPSLIRFVSENAHVLSNLPRP